MWTESNLKFRKGRLKSLTDHLFINPYFYGMFLCNFLVSKYDLVWVIKDSHIKFVKVADGKSKILNRFCFGL